MIRIDLAVSRRRPRLATWQYALIWIAIFLIVVVLGGLGLVYQNRYLENLESDLVNLTQDSIRLSQARKGIETYATLKEDFDFLNSQLVESAAQFDKFFDMVQIIRTQLQSDITLTAYTVTPDSAVIRCRSRSSLKVQRYIESLYQRDRISTFTHEPPSVTGNGEHKIILRIR